MIRSELLSRLGDRSEQWDVLVIGGGSSGMGAALDAASRGYRTVLLEGADFGEGTSSKSTKLIHGGVRYLRSGEVDLVRESLRERGHLLRNAPELVEPMPFVVPAYRWYERFYYGVGLTVYDLLAGKLGIGKTEHFDFKRIKREIPNLNEKGLRGGTMYWDGQFDDARLVVAMARTAVSEGGVVLNHVRANELIHEEGRVAGVMATDQISGTSYRVEARVVINATGVFADSIRKLDDAAASEIMTTSQGIHLVLPLEFLGGHTGIMIPNTDDGRVLFVIPWKNRVILGTTDTGGVDISLHPMAMEEEVEYLLAHAGRYLTKPPCRDDVKAVFAGLRPLVKPASGVEKTAGISRSHQIVKSPSGLLTMAGGKWTTYRQMAEDAVDQAIAVGDLDHKPCVTENLKLDADATKSDESDWVCPELAYTWEELERGVREEMAMTLDDLLSRRSRSALLDIEAAKGIAPEAATRMAAILGKEPEWAEEELSRFQRVAKTYSPPTSQRPSSVVSDGS